MGWTSPSFRTRGKATTGDAGRHLPAASRPVVDDFADELVTEDDVLVRAHKPVVPGLHHDSRQLVARPAGVEIGAADPAPEHPEEHLAGGWFGIGNVRSSQRALVTHHRFHRLDPIRARRSTRATGDAD